MSIPNSSMAILYYPEQYSVSTSEGCCGPGKWRAKLFKFSNERFSAATNHYIIFHIQLQVLSGFEVPQLTNYMLSWASWNWLYLSKVGGRLTSIINVVSSQKLLDRTVAPKEQEKQIRIRDYINEPSRKYK